MRTAIPSLALGTRTTTSTAVCAIAGAALASLTLARYGVTWAAGAWIATQVLLAFVAVFDLAARRIPDRMTVPAAAAAVAVRAVFAPGALPVTAAAGAIAFGVFLLFSIVTRGGLGMGDVKLAGLLGLLLGKAALPALLVGVVAGGVASATVLVAKGRVRGHTIAYGPYLCFGAALAILAFYPPTLV